METNQCVTQLHGISPDELIKTISNTLKNEMKVLLEGLQPKQPQQYYTRKEVSKLFKVTLSTIHKWTKEGKLTPYGIGGRVYFLAEDVDNVVVKLNHQ